MSRCFSFPPPGYTLSEEKYEAWLQLIKRREEKQKEEEKRREEKEKKKEKRREKKEKRRAEKEEKEKKKKKREKKERRKARKEKRRAEKEEKFEGSSVTAEEHRLAADASPSSSCCDSTANTNNNRKRKSSSNDSSSVVFTPTIGRCSWTDAMELQYKNLLENLYLPQQPQLYDGDDSDWLYQRKTPENKRQRIFASDAAMQRIFASDDSSSIACSRSSACAQAQYLHQIDAFALPYVVPF